MGTSKRLSMGHYQDSYDYDKEQRKKNEGYQPVWGENVLIMKEGKYIPGYWYIGKHPKADTHIVLAWYGRPEEVIFIKKDLNKYE